jgi:hypothetical protein
MLSQRKNVSPETFDTTDSKFNRAINELESRFIQGMNKLTINNFNKLTNTH